MQGQSGKAIDLTVRTPSGEQTIEGSDILVAVGRIPNTAGIGLDVLGVELDARGYIKVNERLETRHPRSGRSANVQGARNSPMSRWTTSTSFGTIWPEATEARATGSFHTACTPTRHLPGSA